MKKIKSHSIVKSLNGLIILIAAILVFNTILSFISVRQIRQDNIRMLADTVSAYGRREDNRFASARHFVEWTGTKDPVVRHIKEQNSGDLREDILTLRSRINELRYSTGNSFMFFINLNPQTCDSFHALSSINLSYDDYKAMRNNLVVSSISQTNRLRWNTFQANGQNYLYYAITYNGISLYSVVPVEAVTEGLDKLSIGKNGYVSFHLNGNTEILHHTGKGGSRLSFFYKDFSYSHSRDGIPYSVMVRADVYSPFGEQLIRQLLIIMVLLMAVIISVIYLTSLYRVILMPLEEFNEQLSSVTNEDGFINLESNQIRELDAANEKFRDLTNEIKRLRIGMYEEELAKRKSQITFLQHQIRPHFYLNCLSTIDSMAQLGDTGSVSEMVRFTSTYMRYLFQADRDFVRLEYELTHIRAYIDIQNLRMGEMFIYEENCPPQEKLVLVPPLLLITFVENNVKHARPEDDKKLVITIHVSDTDDGKEKIEISDSGQGFTRNDLDRLNALSEHPETNAPITSEGHGIGISNSIQRLSLLYADRFTLSFYNGTDGTGAHIALTIPRVIENTETDEVKME